MKQTTDRQYELQKLIDLTMEGVKPIVDSVQKSIDYYSTNPSVVTGARRHDTETQAQKSIVIIKKQLWKMWSEQYRSAVSAEEFERMMNKSIQKFCPSTTEGQIWFKAVGLALNGKDGE